MDFRSTGEIRLSLPPSCVAFSPEQQDLLVIGTYCLDKGHPPSEQGKPQHQQRTGSIILYKIQSGGDLQEYLNFACNSGILDIAFSPHDASILCAATSTGSLLFYRISSDPNTTQVLSEEQIFDPSILVLDLEFHPQDPCLLGLTLSTGETAMIRLTSDSPPSVSTDSPPQIIHTAGLEAWTLSFSPTGTLFSGSDDASLSIFPSPPLSSPTTIPRLHEAGVTSVLPLHSSSSLSVLLTGSYDDHLMVSRHPRPPASRTLCSLDLGGGVWRTSYLLPPQVRGEERRWVVLCCCMYAGACVVDVRCMDWTSAIAGREEGDGGWSMDVLGWFKEHESMCYGAAVVPPTNEEADAEASDKGGTKRRVVSTSFYDTRVCIWEIDVPAWN